MSDLDHDKNLDDAKALLESVALLETVAAERETKAGELMDKLADQGMEPEELAGRLEISNISVKQLLARDKPKPVHERIGVSEETVDKLDPLAQRRAEKLRRLVENQD